MVISMWLSPEQFYFLILMRKEEHLHSHNSALTMGRCIRSGFLQEVAGLVRNPSAVSVTAGFTGTRTRGAKGACPQGRFCFLIAASTSAEQRQ